MACFGVGFGAGAGLSGLELRLQRCGRGQWVVCAWDKSEVSARFAAAGVGRLLVPWASESLPESVGSPRAALASGVGWQGPVCRAALAQRLGDGVSRVEASALAWLGDEQLPWVWLRLEPSPSGASLWLDPPAPLSECDGLLGWWLLGGDGVWRDAPLSAGGARSAGVGSCVGADAVAGSWAQLAWQWLSLAPSAPSAVSGVVPLLDKSSVGFVAVSLPSGVVAAVAPRPAAGSFATSAAVAPVGSGGGFESVAAGAVPLSLFSPVLSLSDGGVPVVVDLEVVFQSPSAKLASDDFPEGAWVSSSASPASCRRLVAAANEALLGLPVPGAASDGFDGFDAGGGVVMVQLDGVVASSGVSGLGSGCSFPPGGEVASTGALSGGGLPVRTLWCEQVAGLLDGPVGVLVVRLEGLPQVRARFGFAVSDELASGALAVAAELVPPGCPVTLLEPDAFAVAVPQLSSLAQVEALARELTGRLLAPVAVVSGASFHVSPAAGFAVAPLHGKSVHELLQRASEAASAAGVSSSRTVRWRPELCHDSQEQLELLGEFAAALGSPELFLEFQPKVALAGDPAGSSLVGVEALARWRHPSRGLVPPSQFVPLVESSALASVFTGWALRSALAEFRASRLPRAGVHVSVNVPPQLLGDGVFVDVVADAVLSTSADPAWLVLEVTERSLVSSPGLRESLAALRSLGVRVSVDDFGAGATSLSFLRKFPVDEVKVDRSFVRGVHKDPANRALLKAVVALADAVSVSVCAEGVEHVEEARVLVDLGVQFAQGFFFARPGPLQGVSLVPVRC